MPRPKQRDPRKRFLSLYRFIETNLTEKNWHDLTLRAARVLMSPPEPRPAAKHARIARPRGAARYPAVAHDLDLQGARALQSRFREELAAIRMGDSSPAHTSISRLLESRFDRLKRVLTVPAWYVQEKMIGETLAHKLGIRAYAEKVQRVCIAAGCERVFEVPPSSDQMTCGDRACTIDADNTRRKERRKTQ